MIKLASSAILPHFTAQQPSRFKVELGGGGTNLGRPRGRRVSGFEESLGYIEEKKGKIRKVLS